jgi:hypothetical protein
MLLKQKYIKNMSNAKPVIASIEFLLLLFIYVKEDIIASVKGIHAQNREIPTKIISGTL